MRHLLPGPPPAVTLLRMPLPLYHQVFLSVLLRALIRPLEPSVLHLR